MRPSVIQSTSILLAYFGDPVSAFANTTAGGTRCDEESPYCIRLNATHVHFRNDCNFEGPSLESWNSGMNETVIPWMRKHLDKFKKLKEEGRNEEAGKSFPIYMKKLFAPNSSPSQNFCDGLGKCEVRRPDTFYYYVDFLLSTGQLSDCKALGKELEPELQEKAWFVFEIFAIIDHVYDIIHEATEESALEVTLRKTEIVKAFSYADEIKMEALKKARAEEIGKAVGSAIALLAAAFLGGLGPLAMPGLFAAGAASAVAETVPGTLKSAKQTMTAIQKIEKVSTLVGTTYLGLHGLKTLWEKNPNIVEDTEAAFEAAWAFITSNAQGQIEQDMLSLMNGNETASGWDIIDYAESGLFIDVDPEMRQNLSSIFKQYYTAVAINCLWHTEHAYIIESTAPGDCSSDFRGPLNNRICFEERPGVSYWFYSIDNTKKKHTRSPPGQELLKNGKEFKGLTLDDVIRSSIYVFEHELEDTLKSPDLLRLRNFNSTSDDFKRKAKYPQKELKHYGRVPGAFTLPICRNPGGEQISKVETGDGRNYPCVCGQHGLDITEMKRFLEATRLYELEKYGKVCEKDLDCRQSPRWKSWYGILNMPSDSKVASKRIYPYDHCSDYSAHTTD